MSMVRYSIINGLKSESIQSQFIKYEVKSYFVIRGRFFKSPKCWTCVKGLRRIIISK